MRFNVDLQIRVDRVPTRHFSHRICFENLADVLQEHSLPVRSVPTGRADEPAIRSLFHRDNPAPNTRLRVPVVVEPIDLYPEQKGFTHKLVLRGLRHALEGQFGSIDFESSENGKNTEIAIRIGFAGCADP
jgi:hypothetical protein